MPEFVTNQDQLNEMMLEMFAETTKGFSVEEIEFLDSVYDSESDEYSDWEVSEINRIYDLRM